MWVRRWPADVSVFYATTNYIPNEERDVISSFIVTGDLIHLSMIIVIFEKLSRSLRSAFQH